MSQIAIMLRVQRALPIRNAIGLATEARMLQMPAARNLSAPSRESPSLRFVVHNNGGGSTCRMWFKGTIASSSASSNHFKRQMSSMSVEEYNKRVDDVNSKFAESRLLIEDAIDSQGTTYFADDLADAQDAVKQTLESYDALLADLDDAKRDATRRSMGMKMEQLKGELGTILHSLTHDEEIPSAKS